MYCTSGCGGNCRHPGLTPAPRNSRHRMPKPSATSLCHPISPVSIGYARTVLLMQRHLDTVSLHCIYGRSRTDSFPCYSICLRGDFCLPQKSPCALQSGVLEIRTVFSEKSELLTLEKFLFPNFPKCGGKTLLSWLFLSLACVIEMAWMKLLFVVCSSCKTCINEAT